jgi:hypothetical protein
MAEPATTSPPAAGLAERDALLATKLHLPHSGGGFLARPRLLERLTEGTASELTLVCAPAGFGKTALLADWAHRSQRPAAWLSLDEGTTTQAGSGGMPPPPWTRWAPGSASSSARCWTRRRGRSRRW